MATDEPDDGDPDHICGAETEHTDGPCQFPVGGPDERCHNHPKDGSGPPDGVGSGDPGHSLGGQDEGGIQDHLPDAPPKPALEHGLRCVEDDPTGMLAWLEEMDPDGYDWILAKWRSFMLDVDFPDDSAKADRLLESCVMEYSVRMGRKKQVEQGFTRKKPLLDERGDPVIDPQTHEPVMVVKEWAGNLPVARVAKEIRRMRKRLGVYDDDADVVGGQADDYNAAARRVAQRIDSTVEGEPGGEH